jgi:hypothetical protein
MRARTNKYIEMRVPNICNEKTKHTGFDILKAIFNQNLWQLSFHDAFKIKLRTPSFLTI